MRGLSMYRLRRVGTAYQRKGLPAAQRALRMRPSEPTHEPTPEEFEAFLAKVRARGGLTHE